MPAHRKGDHIITHSGCLRVREGTVSTCCIMVRTGPALGTLPCHRVCTSTQRKTTEQSCPLALPPAQYKKAEIDILAAEYISTVKTLSPDQRVERLQKIQNAYSKCKEYSDDKVQLAMQTYEMVDKHIRRLDADLARFEADLKDKMEGSDFEGSGGRGLKSKSVHFFSITVNCGVVEFCHCGESLTYDRDEGRGQKEKRASRGRGRRTSEEDTPKKKKHKGGSEFTDAILSVHPSDVLDMPVDPNEPTYCLCHQVSYGEMIGCDNPDCPIEWFHFACVDLTTKPKGK
ncbi:inhibitor of growth protein 5 isoform X2 [Callithrix jacchus]